MEEEVVLATRRGTAATRPRVRMVGKVSNLEGSCSGCDCGCGTAEHRALPESTNLSKTEGILLLRNIVNPATGTGTGILFVQGGSVGMYLRPCSWVVLLLLVYKMERGLVLDLAVADRT